MRIVAKYPFNNGKEVVEKKYPKLYAEIEKVVKSVDSTKLKESSNVGNYNLDGIYCSDCVEAMRSMPDESIDLVVTSPPYDSTRNYNGFSYDLHSTGEQLFRLLKSGGRVAMVIQDQTHDFGKTLTSFRTIVDWCDNIGFKLFECVIYRKNGTEGAWWTQRFRVDHEYMPIFVKGKKPQYFNKNPLKIHSKHGGKTMTGSGNRRTNGQTTQTVRREINQMKCRGTVWDYLMAGDKNPIKRKHPAPFPDRIPYDFIQCFCPPNGIVLDPFIGSGSTAVSAKKLGRHYLGFDISKEYCEIAERRLRDTEIESPLFLKSDLISMDKTRSDTISGEYEISIEAIQQLPSTNDAPALFKAGGQDPLV